MAANPSHRHDASEGSDGGVGHRKGENGLTRAVIDVLGDLAAAERNSLVRMVRSNLPVLGKCSPHLLGVLHSLDDDRLARARELRGLLDEVGLLAAPAPAEQADTGAPEVIGGGSPGRVGEMSGVQGTPDPFLSLLSLRFLLLKVAEAQAQLRTRYVNSQGVVAPHTPSAHLVAAHVLNVTAGFQRLETELRAMGLDPSMEG